jgi:hypothetical protein
MKPVSVRSLIIRAGVAVALSVTVAAQSSAPVRGTVALEGTVKMIYAAANTVIVATVDGVDHVYHFTKDLLVHGGKGGGVDALKGLREGSTVVVHYTNEGTQQLAHEIDRVGDEGLKTTEGVITRINRGRKEVTIRFDSGRTETFQLTDRAAADVGKDIDQAANGTTKIIIYYSDDAGQKVAYFFKKKA